MTVNLVVLFMFNIPTFNMTSSQASGPEDAYRRIANGALRVSCLRNSGALAIESEELLRSLLVSWTFELKCGKIWVRSLWWRFQIFF